MPKYFDHFVNVLQFCHLCTKGKVPPIQYSLATTPDINKLFTSISFHILLDTKLALKRPKQNNIEESESEDDTPNPSQKISMTDHFPVYTMLKLHESIDKYNLKINQECEEKEPGFNCLELHQ